MTSPAPHDPARHDHDHDSAHPGPDSHRAVDPAEEFRALFEPEGWDERYAGSGRTWSGRPNAQLVTANDPAEVFAAFARAVGAVVAGERTLDGGSPAR